MSLSDFIYLYLLVLAASLLRLTLPLPLRALCRMLLDRRAPLAGGGGGWEGTCPAQTVRSRSSITSPSSRARTRLQRRPPWPRLGRVRVSRVGWVVLIVFVFVSFFLSFFLSFFSFHTHNLPFQPFSHLRTTAMQEIVQSVATSTGINIEVDAVQAVQETAYTPPAGAPSTAPSPTPTPAPKSCGSNCGGDFLSNNMLYIGAGVAGGIIIIFFLCISFGTQKGQVDSHS